MSQKTYATLDAFRAMDFRTISREMHKLGYKMGASRARLIMLDALKEIVVALGKSRGLEFTEKEVQEIATSPEFQNVIAPFVQSALKERDRYDA